MSQDITSKFIASKKDFSQYPNVHLYEDSRKEAFWVLEVAAREFSVDRLTAGQVADILVEKFQISRTSRAVGSALGQAAGKGLVHKDEKTNEFKLMKKGRDDLYLTSVKNPGVLYIGPGTHFSGKLTLFSSILSQMKNKVWICDPHIGPRLLDILHKLDKKIRIRILTRIVHDKAAFIRELADFKQEHPNTDVKLAQPRVLHDRYILSDTGMWLVGHSLKDLGSKETFIVKLGDDIKHSMEAVFNNRWTSAGNLI